MTKTDQTRLLAEQLTSLKERSGLTYEVLGRRLAVGRSTLHRYCSGLATPPDFAVVERLGRLCGADQVELLELHRRWALASYQVEGGVDDRFGDDERLRPRSTLRRVDASDDTVRGISRGKVLRMIVVGLLVITVTSLGLVVVTRYSGRPADTPTSVGGPLLLSSACPPEIGMGEHDECVREAQRLLSKAGAKLSVDADFGPETLRRVTAYQVLSGLQPRGVVDEATKRALYAGGVKVPAQSTAQIEHLIVGVFVEDPQKALHIARCQSFVDPLYVLPNTNGTRNWGVFQLSDTVLRKYGGTPLQAFDPTWNVTIAHRLWAEHRDFRAWPYCAAA